MLLFYQPLTTLRSWEEIRYNHKRFTKYEKTIVGDSWKHFVNIIINVTPIFNNLRSLLEEKAILLHATYL